MGAAKVHVRFLFASSVALLMLLAGCSDSPSADPPRDPTDDLDLKATEDTGIIRGYVVDNTITPLAGVSITLEGTAKSAQTTDTGVFGFDALEPGTYFVSAQKAGFTPARQSVEVVAGEDEPPALRILLEADAQFVAPYVETYVLEGYIQCGVTTPGVAVAVCSIPNGCFPGFGVCATNQNFTQDYFNLFVPVDNVPQHIQHEVVWEATQSTGNMFNLAMRTATREQFDAGGYNEDIGGDIIGTSPLVGIINATMIEDEEIGLDGLGLAPAVFTGGMEGTEPCVPAPADICLFPTGATVNQRFTMYTHIFHGYTPPEDWRFSTDSTVPPPPQ